MRLDSCDVNITRLDSCDVNIMRLDSCDVNITRRDSCDVGIARLCNCVALSALCNMNDVTILPPGGPNYNYNACKNIFCSTQKHLCMHTTLCR